MDKRICQIVIALTAMSALAAPTKDQPTERDPQVIYQIFPRSFQDSRGTGVGDIDGITSRLDYINDGGDNSHSLGADAVWLTPIFTSPTYHGYDTTNYEEVSPELGDLAAVQRLTSAAHNRGIRVLLDMSVNHTSIEHSWFQTDTNHDFYMWSPEPLDWKHILLAPGESPLDHWHARDGLFYFATYGNGSDADLNWRNPLVYQKIAEVFKFWVRQGVDGFRLDSAKYLVKGSDGEQNMPETHDIWKKLVIEVRELAPQTYFIGEIWDSAENIAAYYGNGDELDSAFDFPVEGALRSSLVQNEATDFYQALIQRSQLEPGDFFTSPFAGNHDQPRLADIVNGDVAKMKLAALAVLSLPGTATVYYGDEIGLPNGTLPQHQGDLAQRTPMQWDPALGLGFTTAFEPWLAFAGGAPEITVQNQLADSTSLLTQYRDLIRLKRERAELNSGPIEQIKLESPSVVSFVRQNPDGSGGLKIVINFGVQSIALRELQKSKVLWPTTKTRSKLAGHSGIIYSYLRP